MALLSTIWVSLIALASITDAFQLQSLSYCITIRRGGPDGLKIVDTPLCPGTGPINVESPFTIFSGFAPGTSLIPVLRPKWQEEYKISADANTLLEYDTDYCLVSKEISGWRQHGCAESCYESSARMNNPYYKLNSGDGSRPNFSNQISGHTGWHFTPQPDNCLNPNVPYDQSSYPLFKPYQPKAVGSLPLAADAFNTADGITGSQISTPNVDGLGDPEDELVGYAQLSQPELTTEDPSVAVFDSSKWNVKRGAVGKEGAVAIPFQA